MDSQTSGGKMGGMGGSWVADIPWGTVGNVIGDTFDRFRDKQYNNYESLNDRMAGAWTL